MCKHAIKKLTFTKKYVTDQKYVPVLEKGGTLESVSDC